MKSSKKYLFTTFFLLVLGVLVFIFLQFCEMNPPQVQITPEPQGYLSAQNSFKLHLSDKGRGLKEVAVYLEQDNKHIPVLTKSYPCSFSKGSGILSQDLELKINPLKLGLHDGPALLVITARDCSWWHWGHGNETQSRYSVIIDTTPPVIEVMTRYINIVPSGSALVIYRASEPLAKQGVNEADRYFFKGYPLKGLYVCIFAYPYDAPRDMLLRVVGVDKAGNRSEGGFYYHILRPYYKKDHINITDNFLHAKMPDFWSIYPELQGKYLETFLKVNTDLRRRSNEEIKRLCQRSNPYPLFEGAFIRMKGAIKATFGDQRTYYYHHQKIGNSVHLGVDIASVAHAPIPAANNGIVVFKGFLGVYGNAIIIDHGLGVFSLYGHLSSFKVNVGERVTKGQIIGYTGATGLAGGDHLHFSLLVQGYFVNPMEWWDKHWMKTHILNPLKQAGVIP